MQSRPESHSLVAWEFHFQLISTAGVEVVPTGSAGGPVQEQGNPALVSRQLESPCRRNTRTNGSGGGPLLSRVQNEL